MDVSREKAMNSTFPKSAILFGVQLLLICTVVIASVINTSLYNKVGDMWIAMLSSSPSFKYNQRVSR